MLLPISWDGKQYKTTERNLPIFRKIAYAFYT